MKKQTISKEQLLKAREANLGKRIEVVTVDLNEEGTEQTDLLVQAPSRTVINEYEKWSERDPNKGRSILIRGCVLNADEAKAVEANDVAFYSLPNALVKLLPIAKATLKNF